MIKPDLKALSDAATQGEWEVRHDDELWQIGVDGQHVMAGDPDSVALAAALVNLYRSGDLVQRAPEREAVAWQPMSTAPKDGSEILILAHDMVIQARYEPGQWSEDTPINPREYSGPVWCAFDDALSFEIEECPDGDWCSEVTGWLPLPIAVPLYRDPAPVVDVVPRSVCINVMASLAAAISLLERGGKAAKKAAPSDKMFDQMIVDYKRSLEHARAALIAMGNTDGQ